MVRDGESSLNNDIQLLNVSCIYSSPSLFYYHRKEINSTVKVGKCCEMEEVGGIKL